METVSFFIDLDPLFGAPTIPVHASNTELGETGAESRASTDPLKTDDASDSGKELEHSPASSNSASNGPDPVDGHSSSEAVQENKNEPMADSGFEDNGNNALIVPATAASEELELARKVYSRVSPSQYYERFNLITTRSLII